MSRASLTINFTLLKWILSVSFIWRFQFFRRGNILINLNLQSKNNLISLPHYRYTDYRRWKYHFGSPFKSGVNRSTEFIIKFEDCKYWSTLNSLTRHIFEICPRLTFLLHKVLQMHIDYKKCDPTSTTEQAFASSKQNCCTFRNCFCLNNLIYLSVDTFYLLK